MLRAVDSAICDFTHEPGGAICYGHWILLLVTSHTKAAVRVVAVKKFCVLCYYSRYKGYDLFRALVSASSDITHETAATICYRHWILRLVISHTRQRGSLSTLGSASCDILHETEGLRLATGIGFCVF